MRFSFAIERTDRAFLGFVVPLPASLTLAVLAGWLMDLGFPDRDWWPLTLLGTALMMASLRGFGVGKALLIEHSAALASTES